MELLVSKVLLEYKDLLVQMVSKNERGPATMVFKVLVRAK